MGHSINKKKEKLFSNFRCCRETSIKKSPSNYAIIGRYILPKIFSEIKKLKPGKGKEIHITDAIKKLIADGEKFYGNIFKGKYLDCGTMKGYITHQKKLNRFTNEVMYDWNRICWFS